MTEGDGCYCLNNDKCENTTDTISTYNMAPKTPHNGHTIRTYNRGVSRGGHGPQNAPTTDTHTYLQHGPKTPPQGTHIRTYNMAPKRPHNGHTYVVRTYNRLPEHTKHTRLLYIHQNLAGSQTDPVADLDTRRQTPVNDSLPRLLQTLSVHHTQHAVQQKIWQKITK